MASANTTVDVTAMTDNNPTFFIPIYAITTVNLVMIGILSFTDPTNTPTRYALPYLLNGYDPFTKTDFFHSPGIFPRT